MTEEELRDALNTVFQANEVEIGKIAERCYEVKLEGTKVFFKGRNGEVLFSKDLVFHTARDLDLLAIKTLSIKYPKGGFDKVTDLYGVASALAAINNVAGYKKPEDIVFTDIATIVSPIAVSPLGIYVTELCICADKVKNYGENMITYNNAQFLANDIGANQFNDEDSWSKFIGYANELGVDPEELYRHFIAGGELYENISEKALTDLLTNGKITYEKYSEIFSRIKKENLGDDINDKMNEAANAKEIIVDPIILDLNGNGITKTTIKEGTYFDLNGDGFAEKTEWIENEDGLLIRDLNGNGKVDNAGELIGENQLLSNGKLSKNGLEVLQDLDTNKDGYLDKNDLAYSELLVWRDLNGNGKVDDKELSTLDELGIDKLKLYENLEEDAIAGSGIKKDGTEFKISDEFFEVNRVDSVDLNYSDEETEDEVSKLPQIFGTGNVTNLRDSMRKNEELKNLVSEFISNPSLLNSIELLDDILFQWCEVSEIDKNSRGNNIDARVLEVVEKFAGKKFGESSNSGFVLVAPGNINTSSNLGSGGALVQNNIPINPNNGAAPIIEECYNEIKDYVLLQLGLKSYLKDYLDLIKVELNEVTGEYFCDLSKLEEFAENNMNKSEVALAFRQLSSIYKDVAEVDNKLNIVIENLKADSTQFSVLYGIEKFILNKSGSINGNDTNDYIVGSLENDNIYGGKGNDYLEGKAGNDYLNGGVGDDTFVYGKGYGNDTIAKDYYSLKEQGTLIMKDLNKEDIEFRAKGDNLVLKIKETGETITIENYLDRDSYKIGKIEFNNGTLLFDDLVEEIKKNPAIVEGTENNDYVYYHYDSSKWMRVNVKAGNGNDNIYTGIEDDYIEGGAGNDYINSGSGNDEVYGGEGNDTIYGEAGNDKLYGGAGDDYLEGGAGNDTYVYSKGDGNDRIYDYSSVSGEVDKLILNDINSSDVSLSKEGYNLVVSINGTEDKITINDHYYSSNYRLENIMFADGVNVSCDNTGNFDIEGTVAMLKQTYCLTSEDEAIINTSNINTENNTDDSSFVAFLNTNQQ